MVQFVNSFSLATNHQQTEVICRFGQTFPRDGEDSTPEPVADIIMPASLARDLIKNLQRLLGDESTDLPDT